MTMRECYEAIGGRCPGTPSQRSNDLQLKQAKQEQQKRESIMCGKYYINSKKNKIFCA